MPASIAACGRACSNCAIAVRQSDASHSSGAVSTAISAAFAIRGGAYPAV